MPPDQWNLNIFSRTNKFDLWKRKWGYCLTIKKKIQQITTRKEKHPAVKREMKQHDPLSQNFDAISMK